MKGEKTAAVKLLISRGAFLSENAAEGFILAGRVLIGGKVIRSKGQAVGALEPVRIRGYNKQYVGRGGVKLAHALSSFSIDLNGRIALDTGASAGGFTDCLLKHGAARVYAVEAGVGQLHANLRNDARVVNLENTNIGDPKLADVMSPPPTLASVDIGYLSLRKAVPIIYPLMDEGAELVCLVKPLFEIDDALIRRTGDIKPADYEPILKSLIADLTTDKYGVVAVTHSPIPGGKGTREFFVHIGSEVGTDLDGQIFDSIERVLEIPEQPEDEDGYF